MMMLMMASMMPRDASVCRCDRDIPIELPGFVKDEFIDAGGFHWAGLRTCVTEGLLFFRPDGSVASRELLRLVGDQSSVRPGFIALSVERAERWRDLIVADAAAAAREADPQYAEDLLLDAEELNAVIRFLRVCTRHGLYLNKYLYPAGAQ